MKKRFLSFLFGFGVFALSADAVDNSSLKGSDLGKHYKTYGLVYVVPEAPMSKVLSVSNGPLREILVQNKVFDALNRTNIPHITVLHLHTKDTTLPQKMLKALPKPPKPFNLTLKKFAFIKASKNSSMPWWFDINVDKNAGYEAIAAFNAEAVKALTPLRDSPLPRVSGSIYKDSSPEAKSQIEELGVSGLNRTKNGKEERMYRPHITLSYSMMDLNANIENELTDLANELNGVITDGIKASFNSVSIVEIGFSGNVLREIYRIDLKTGKVTDVAKELQK
ncbi:hypothetical protein LS71_002345 [Helicobacter jaachi]|uniref:DUF1045 domain-containing protein n=1 Tax=Helicobacter jaachi TaxID=1677920 RepID=A0A4U8TCE0_9HELI|nr:hypothetical protein [Helicobacter jaachi]TLD97605.1 hypothetical protein LS71_002345 [Helicobacter jaachi]